MGDALGVSQLFLFLFVLSLYVYIYIYISLLIGLILSLLYGRHLAVIGLSSVSRVVCCCLTSALLCYVSFGMRTPKKTKTAETGQVLF